jgi:hypothetical protein
MTWPALLFVLLYWPCLRLAQVLERIADGKQLGSQRDETVIGDISLTGIIHWVIYLVVGISAVW